MREQLKKSAASVGMREQLKKSAASVGMREQLKETVRPGQRRVALVTYSTKPRGGVVHTLSLADAMVDQAMDVSIVALGHPDQGFFRPVRAPYVLGFLRLHRQIPWSSECSHR